tara:strand:+ start:352 stop:687 length:336 start_codon:yes stop_codon:yes gene_type:complete
MNKDLLKQLDKLAMDNYSEFGFSTCSAEEQHELLQIISQTISEEAWNDNAPTLFTGEELTNKLDMLQIAEDLQNHLVFDHSYTSYLTISLVIINIIATIYLFYKLNTITNG